ncbi:hypothetical protein ANANG_G00029030 [Anguilla anguilla]|uniref:Uncharacterized protein n=1 Tax=Anguilla anguilla TaxID=7936 RepID=A0A9D3MRH1_ANGAN|nr:hypothetical protein ANANG_G00029030 [Anguilla anguilla]
MLILFTSVVYYTFSLKSMVVFYIRFCDWTAETHEHIQTKFNNLVTNPNATKSHCLTGDLVCLLNLYLNCMYVRRCIFMICMLPLMQLLFWKKPHRC